jgi:hypothetical protein
MHPEKYKVPCLKMWVTIGFTVSKCKIPFFRTSINTDVSGFFQFLAFL